MHYSSPEVVRMAIFSRDAFVTLNERVSDPVYHSCGWLFLVPEELAAGARQNAADVRAAGAVAETLSAVDAREIEPSLNPEGVDMVVYEPESGFADPIRTTGLLLDEAATHGASARTGVAVRALQIRDGRVVGVETDSGRVACQTVVLAAGAWSRKLAASVGVELPLEITREQDLLVACADGVAPHVSISNAVDQIYLRPLVDSASSVGAIIGRGFPKQYEHVDPDAYDGGLDGWFEDDVRKRATLRFGALGSAPRTDGRSGLYAVTPDWQPLLGTVADVAGLVLATGGSGHCFKLGPAIGEMVAASLVGEERTDLPPVRLFDLARFERNELFISRYGGNRG